MRANTLVTLGASAAFGIMAIVLARGWINDAIQSEFRQAQPAKAGALALAPAFRTVPVLVADADYGFGDELTAEGLRLVDMPEDLVPEGAYSTYDALFTEADARTVALTRITFNEPVLSYKISGPGGRGSLSALISEGMRAAAIRVNDVAGVAGFILPGDYIDVIYTRDQAARRNGNNLIADVLLQNIRVLGVDQNLSEDSRAANVMKTVTVEVSNSDAQRLNLAMDTGKLSLTLRRAGETAQIPARRLASNQLAAQVKTGTKPRNSKRKTRIYVAPKPASPSTADITIIRGETRDQVSVLRDSDDQEKMAGG